jgi:8-oxo-dGTP pyrophosphatase MutT (NUDIX family)
MKSGEMVDILDEQGGVVASISRQEAEAANHMTSNVLVFIFNSKGKVWAQLRPKTKRHYPGRWDISACGGIESGESHEVAAARETKEETGLVIPLLYAGSFLNVFIGDNGEERRRLSYLYIGKTDATPLPGPDADEFACWDIEELRAELKTHPEKYVPSFSIELEKALKQLVLFPVS